jgi:hypothetical protein
VVALAAAVAIAAGTGLAVHLAGGPGRPDRAEVIAALKRDPRTADVPDAAASCIADWYLTYASAEQLEALVDRAGTTDPTATDAAVTPEAKTAILECLKQAT